jgi:YD repeat-containing protein
VDLLSGGTNVLTITGAGFEVRGFTSLLDLDGEPLTNGADLTSYEYFTVFRTSATPGQSVTLQVEAKEADGDVINTDSIVVRCVEARDPLLYEFSAKRSGQNSALAKIALNGRPLPVPSPDAPRSDGLPDGTYVDAMGLQLHHRVTDVALPVPGSALPLDVTRNFTPEIWHTKRGLTPKQEIFRPFGPGWRSSLGMHLRICVVPGETRRATVTDANGVEHEFVAAPLPWPRNAADEPSLFAQSVFLGADWRPIPGANDEAATSAAKLEAYSSAAHPNVWFRFQTGFGTSVLLEKIPALEMLAVGNSLAGRSEFQAYYRVAAVLDAAENELDYQYTSENHVIPKRIVSKKVSSLFISILTDSANRVTDVWDAIGNKYHYDYAPNAAVDCSVLTGVRRADGTKVSYDYVAATETDQRPSGYSVPNAEFKHFNLWKITDGKQNTYQFEYKPDQSRQGCNSSVTPNQYYTQPGSPRFLWKVTLPGNPTPVVFLDLSNNLKLVLDDSSAELTAHLPERSDVCHSSHRCGKSHHPLRLPAARSSPSPDRVHGPPCAGNHASARGRLLEGNQDHLSLGKDGAVGIRSKAALAVTKFTDMANLVTEFSYEDVNLGRPQLLPPFPPDFPTSHYPLDALDSMWPSLAMGVGDWHKFHGDPTKVKDPLNHCLYCLYHPENHHRVGAIDSTGRATASLMNANGDPSETRTWQTTADVATVVANPAQGRHSLLAWWDESSIAASSSSHLAGRVSYEYGSGNFPGVATTITAHTSSEDLPWNVSTLASWDTDLVTSRTVSSSGRIVHVETGDLKSDLHLRRQWKYDLHGGRPRPPNRLPIHRHQPPAQSPAPYASGTTASAVYAYDANGNLLTSRDVTGHTTSYAYDAQNRLHTRTEFLSTGNLTTSFDYNKVGALTDTTDPKTFVTHNRI